MRDWRVWAAALLIAALGGGCAQLKPAPAAADTVPPPLVLVVEAPGPSKALLEQHLDLARLAAMRVDESLDDTEWARLIAATPAQARELLQTEGFFEATVQVTREDTSPPRVRVRVTPGPRAEVDTVRLSFDGMFAQQLAAKEPQALALEKQLQAAGPLRPGSPFRNADWSETKLQWLARLRAAGFASATVQHSQADVDVPTRLAQLAVTLASGPLFLAGPLHIEGLKLHDERTVRRLAGFGPGTPLTETLLLDYQDRLQKSGLFEAVSVSFDPDAAQASGAAVSVRLSELPLQQATIGAGFSDNTGPRISIEHTHRKLFGARVTSYNKLEWGRDAQKLTADFYSHPGEDFGRNLLGVQAERVKGDTDTVLSQRLRLGRTTDTPQLERLYFGELLRSRQSLNSGGLIDARAISGNVHLVLRRLDSVLLPTRGYSASLQLGAGQASSNVGERGPFGRVYSRLTGYWPLGGQWFGTARIEAGQIIKRDAVIVPDALGFRAGGDDSVRGYAYRTLAPLRDGNIISGNVLLTGSAEIARPIFAKLPAVWGAVFVDAGRAADSWADYKPALGYGVGLRWRSPIGPLRVDLAWGEELRKARLHLSVGIAF
ncbi:autotransporter assembly complex protein TamA [Aquabacterium sp.]|uniref:autotransporter assembly complex protein TamA n=1 Tax=Aquabacterium sp. TaxID=1872578 RepID=UPI002C0293B8|nr:BamA/TamA family outer membrane protein [Aquabacterium sp.]HSW06852.1 BamA/TamA family outer membrane protein [Aquabacterium sp.]